MKLSSLLQLVLLAALWGSSFLFIKIAAIPLGPAYLMEARVFFAALTLFVIALYLKKNLDFIKHIRHYFILGFFSVAFPFLLFAYAAQTLNASLLSILNSTAVIWGTIITAIITQVFPTKKVILGLVLGILGVCVLVGGEASILGDNFILPIIAATVAAMSYGVASNYAKYSPKLPSFNNAHGSMWAAVIIVLPTIPFFPYSEVPTLNIWLAVIALGIFCTAIANVLYFKLIDDIGPPSALSVAFLIPVFGILWGWLFLEEHIGVNTILGAALIVLGTMLVTGFSLRMVLMKK